MTLQGKSAAEWGISQAQKKLEAATGKLNISQVIIVSIDMAQQDVIMLRWDPPEK